MTTTAYVKINPVTMAHKMTEGINAKSKKSNVFSPCYFPLRISHNTFLKSSSRQSLDMSKTLALNIAKIVKLKSIKQATSEAQF